MPPIKTTVPTGTAQLARQTPRLALDLRPAPAALQTSRTPPWVYVSGPVYVHPGRGLLTMAGPAPGLPRMPVVGDTVRYVGADGVTLRCAVADGAAAGPDTHMDLQVFASAETPVPPSVLATGVPRHGVQPYLAKTWHWPYE